MLKTGLIAFCGSKGSGKSTSATIFSEIFKIPVEELALAEHLKNTSSEVFDVPLNYFLDPNLKEVELESYVVLTRNSIKSVLTKFEAPSSEDANLIRPHVGKILKTPREILQYVGTEILRPIDPLIHTRSTAKNKDPHRLSILTDMRFVNEFRFLKEQFGKSFTPVYVSNPRAETVAQTDTHASEREYVKFKNDCYHLDNSKSLKELRDSIKVLIKDVFNEDLS